MRLFLSCAAVLLACCLPALAQQQRKSSTRYGPGVCGPADPTYIRTAEESGGHPLFLAPNEVAKSFVLMSELTRSNHVTLLWARGELSEGHDFVVPVDSTVKRLVFSLSFDTPGGKLAALDPEGKEVTSETPGAVITPLNCGDIVTVAPPAPGKWHVRVAGKGRFWLEASGVSDIFMVGAEFVHLAGRPGHEGYFRISGQPVAGEPAMLRVELSGKTRNVQFRLISPEAKTLQPVTMKADSEGTDESEYLGELSLPATPFRLSVTGEDESGHPFERVFSSLFHAETVEVTPLDPGLEDLPAGKTVPVRFKIRNAGAAREFRILAVDTKDFLTSHEPQVLSLAGGESRELPVELNIPANPPGYTRDTVIITATATSGQSTTNNAVLEFRVRASSANKVQNSMSFLLFSPVCVVSTRLFRMGGREQAAGLLGAGGFHGLTAAVDVADNARGINYKSGAFGDAQKTENAVLAGDFLFRIRQKRKCQAQLLRKAAVGFRLVDADAQNLGAHLSKIGKTILVCREFLRSARGIGVDVESQNDAALSPKIAQPDQPARVVGQFKIRCRVSDVQCHPGCL